MSGGCWCFCCWLMLISSALRDPWVVVRLHSIFALDRHVGYEFPFSHTHSHTPTPIHAARHAHNSQVFLCTDENLWANEHITYDHRNLIFECMTASQWTVLEKWFSRRRIGCYAAFTACMFVCLRLLEGNSDTDYYSNKIPLQII